MRAARAELGAAPNSEGGDVGGVCMAILRPPHGRALKREAGGQHLHEATKTIRGCWMAADVPLDAGFDLGTFGAGAGGL